MQALREQMLILYCTPLYVFIIGAELLASHLQGIQSYSWKDTLQKFLSQPAYRRHRPADAWRKHDDPPVLFSFHLFDLTHSIWYWTSLLLMVDMLHYWQHRLGHMCRLFWAVHVNHHSSTHFNFTVGFRSGVLEPFYSFVFFIPAAIIGYAPIDIFLCIPFARYGPFSPILKKCASSAGWNMFW